MMLRLQTLTLVILIQISMISDCFGEAQPAIPSAEKLNNATAKVMENRLVQNVRTAADNLASQIGLSTTPSQSGSGSADTKTSADSSSAPNAITIKEMLKLLEAQNSKVGDACDSTAWKTHVKPIYDALYMGNSAEQNKKNDEFALAILKDHSIISKVCLSASHIMECASGKCQCLTKLPADLKYSSQSCQNITGTEGQRSGDAAEGRDGAGFDIMGYLHNLLGFVTGAASSTSPFGKIETFVLCLGATTWSWMMVAGNVGT